MNKENEKTLKCPLRPLFSPFLPRGPGDHNRPPIPFYRLTAARPPVYTSVENCPAWARETVQKAVDEGVLRGDQGGGLRLTDDNLVNLQMLRNLGLLDGGGA